MSTQQINIPERCRIERKEVVRFNMRLECAMLDEVKFVGILIGEDGTEYEVCAPSADLRGVGEWVVRGGMQTSHMDAIEARLRAACLQSAAIEVDKQNGPSA